MFYKIRHIPTGLFYRPGRACDKKNLSKNGKAYQQKPTLKWLGGIYGHPVPKKSHYGDDWEYRKVIESEWEIVEYDAR